MGDDLRRAIAGSGPLLLAIGVAALAGLVSILSPCVLPLVPGYLSYVTGLAGSDLDATAAGRTATAAAVSPWRPGSGRQRAGAGRHAAVRARLRRRLHAAARRWSPTSASRCSRTRTLLNIVLGVPDHRARPGLSGLDPGPAAGGCGSAKLPAAGLLGAPVFGGDLRALLAARAPARRWARCWRWPPRAARPAGR